MDITLLCLTIYCLQPFWYVRFVPFQTKQVLLILVEKKKIQVCNWMINTNINIKINKPPTDGVELVECFVETK